MMNLYTIGFTQKKAANFFGLLKEANVQCLIDIRLHPEGQLSGFAKKADLKFFLRVIIDCDYVHETILAPSEEILKAYRSDKNWVKYEQQFRGLMLERGIPKNYANTIFLDKVCCLLCSEHLPDKCHRRIVAELFTEQWQELKTVHLI